MPDRNSGQRRYRSARGLDAVEPRSACNATAAFSDDRRASGSPETGNLAAGCRGAGLQADDGASAPGMYFRAAGVDRALRPQIGMSASAISSIMVVDWCRWCLSQAICAGGDDLPCQGIPKAMTTASRALAIIGAPEFAVCSNNSGVLAQSSSTWMMAEQTRWGGRCRRGRTARRGRLQRPAKEIGHEDVQSRWLSADCQAAPGGGRSARHSALRAIADMSLALMDRRRVASVERRRRAGSRVAGGHLSLERLDVCPPCPVAIVSHDGGGRARSPQLWSIACTGAASAAAEEGDMQGCLTF